MGLLLLLPTDHRPAPSSAAAARRLRGEPSAAGGGAYHSSSSPTGAASMAFESFEKASGRAVEIASIRKLRRSIGGTFNCRTPVVGNVSNITHRHRDEETEGRLVNDRESCQPRLANTSCSRATRAAIASHGENGRWFNKDSCAGLGDHEARTSNRIPKATRLPRAYASFRHAYLGQRRPHACPRLAAPPQGWLRAIARPADPPLPVIIGLRHPVPSSPCHYIPSFSIQSLELRQSGWTLALPHLESARCRLPNYAFSLTLVSSILTRSPLCLRRQSTTEHDEAIRLYPEDDLVQCPRGRVVLRQRDPRGGRQDRGKGRGAAFWRSHYRRRCRDRGTGCPKAQRFQGRAFLGSYVTCCR